MLWRTVLAAAVVAAAALAPAGADAGVRHHRHRHGTHARTHPTRHARHHGAPCAVGLWFRPSKGSCSRVPYGGRARRGRIVHAVQAPRAGHAVRLARATHFPGAAPPVPVVRDTAYTPPEGMGWVGAFRRPRSFQ